MQPIGFFAPLLFGYVEMKIAGNPLKKGKAGFGPVCSSKNGSGEEMRVEILPGHYKW